MPTTIDLSPTTQDLNLAHAILEDALQTYWHSVLTYASTITKDTEDAARALMNSARIVGHHAALALQELQHPDGGA